MLKFKKRHNFNHFGFNNVTIPISELKPGLSISVKLIFHVWKIFERTGVAKRFAFDNLVII